MFQKSRPRTAPAARLGDNTHSPGGPAAGEHRGPGLHPVRELNLFLYLPFTLRVEGRRTTPGGVAPTTSHPSKKHWESDSTAYREVVRGDPDVWGDVVPQCRHPGRAEDQTVKDRSSAVRANPGGTRRAVTGGDCRALY